MTEVNFDQESALAVPTEGTGQELVVVPMTDEEKAKLELEINDTENENGNEAVEVPVEVQADSDSAVVDPASDSEA
jgi:hypothetical protein